MRVLILGVDGYLGWPTAMYLAMRGHQVYGVDNFEKRKLEHDCKVAPLVPLADMMKRASLFEKVTGKNITFTNADITHGIQNAMLMARPDAVIHYAEQPSAPYSMIGRKECIDTQRNNVVGTLQVLWAFREWPDAHLIKLGTMGEYGTPNIDIEEGWLTVEHNGRRDRVLYPKKPGSWYHASKVHDSTNIEMACRVWGLRATDLNQGVVYGFETEETQMHPRLHTSFHYDQYFGTAINRFVTQAVAGMDLTVYGDGSQTRGWLNIRDTLRCVELAMLHPAERGEFVVMNQFTEQFSVLELANRIARLTGARIQHLQNPRVEQEDHYYNAKHSALPALGLEPHLLTDKVLHNMVAYVHEHKQSIDLGAINPSVTWR